MDPQLPAVPNFPELEEKWLKHWYTKGIVERYLHKNDSSKKRFSFIDGPITANNPMGIHHGWGRTNKDLWQRFFNLLGYKERFQNGFDCQGLWVEVEVEKELGLRSKKDIENLVPGNSKASINKFVQLCKDRVLKFSAIQTEQSKRLGYFMDWDNSYFTMSDENNYMIWHFLKTCWLKGWMYKGRSSVPWCPRCETAISQHEMLTEDYKEATHESIYLELKIKGREKEYLLVWTTTPWTIPANIAVAVDKALDYSLVEGTTGDWFWIASESIERVFGTEYKKIVKKIKGKELIGLTYSAPFDSLDIVIKTAQENPKTFHTVIATDNLILPIVTTEGTGLVHTAVSAGVEDFKLGKKYGLPMIPVIADNADYLPELGFLAGKNAKKNPRIILDYLEEQDKLENACVFKIEKYTHRYPACWRCKTELVWKVADEWYIAMDVPDKTDPEKQTFRQQMIGVAKTINWIPSFGLERELDWLKNMHDWLISKKNRYWGLALPIYECTHCGSVQFLGGKDELKDKAVSGWREFEGHTPHKPWIDEVEIKCNKCNKPVKRINDVGNVWLDAGIVPYATLVDPVTKKLSYTTDKKYFSDWFPATFITESFPGQFKNWFYSLIAMSTALEKKAPFKTVLGYATVVGEDGRPMHKSWGNAINFNEAADKIGADVARWMFVRQDPEKNVPFGYKKAEETKRTFHIPLWNSLKFFLTYAGLDKWKVSTKKPQVTVLDAWILSRLYESLTTAHNQLHSFNSEKAALAIEGLVTDLSQWYLRQSRTRIWNNSLDTDDKNAFYSTLKTTLEHVIIAISPLIPFFSEELHSLLKMERDSVHLENWPVLDKKWKNNELLEDMQLVRQYTEAVHSERKRLSLKVKQPLKQVTITSPHTFLQKDNTEQYIELLKTELNVKEVHFKKAKNNEISAVLDTSSSPELELEGKVRGYVRAIQQKRKDSGCAITEEVHITIPKIPDEFVAPLKLKLLAKSITFTEGTEITVTRDQ